MNSVCGSRGEWELASGDSPEKGAGSNVGCLIWGSGWFCGKTDLGGDLFSDFFAMNGESSMTNSDDVATGVCGDFPVSSMGSIGAVFSVGSGPASGFNAVCSDESFMASSAHMFSVLV